MSKHNYLCFPRYIWTRPRLCVSLRHFTELKDERRHMTTISPVCGTHRGFGSHPSLTTVVRFSQIVPFHPVWRIGTTVLQLTSSLLFPVPPR